MRQTCAAWLGLMAGLAAACGGGGGTGGEGGTARATIEGRTFDVSGVELLYETGPDGFFRIAGDAAGDPHEDCVPGLSGGLALYGPLPSTVTSLSDLAGQELPFEFTGDGDDFNLCFVGSNGLLGVEEGTVRFTAVEGSRVTFTFSGSFRLYDGRGGESPTPVSASGEGTAYVQR